MNHPECSVLCCSGMYEALSCDFTIEILPFKDVKIKKLKKYHIVAFPGGIGDSDSFEYLLKNRADDVAEYIGNGGRYLGICMGAYWASKYYFNLLDDVEAVQYIKRRKSDIKRSYATIADVLWNNETQSMYFYDGCALIGDKSKMNIVSTYANGDPMAIYQKRIGLIGCHPESMPSWYDRPYLQSYWHEFAHHKLLLAFVNKLMKA